MRSSLQPRVRDVRAHARGLAGAAGEGARGHVDFAQALTDALEEEGIDPRDARIAASLLISVHRQFFRAARMQALAGKHGPAAARRLRSDLERAYTLLEHGLGGLGAHTGTTAKAAGTHR